MTSEPWPLPSSGRTGNSDARGPCQAGHLRKCERTTMELQFRKAVQFGAKLRLAVCGPSGSGKTYTLLALATELGGSIAVVDTEHGSASKYADIFEFDV